MTISVGGVSVYLIDDTTRFQSGMRAAASLVETSAARMRTATAGAEKAVKSLGSSTRGFSPDAFRSLSLSALRAKSDVEGLRNAILAIPALAGGFGGAILAQQITQRADSYTNLKNRIASVVEGQRDQIAAERDLFEVAQRTRSSLQSNAALFARLRSSSATLAADPDKLLRTVETVQKSFQVGGATTAEAQSSALQLAQALGSGRLQGDELRSILENNIPLAKMIAKEFGVAVGQLKELGSEGTLTSDRVIKAILDGSQEIDSTFNRLKPTFAQSLQVLDNSLTRTIGKFDEATGTSAFLANGIIAISNNLDGLAQAGLAAGAALASVFVGRSVSSLRNAAAEKVGAQRAKLAEAEAAAIARVADARETLSSIQERDVGKRLQAVAQEEAALKRLDQQAKNNLQGQIQLQDRIDALRQNVAANRIKDSQAADAAAVKAAEKQQAALDKLAAARLRDQQAEQALNAKLADPEQGNRKNLKPLYEAAFDRDAARDARQAAESRAAAIRSELDRLEAQGPASRKKKDIATFDAQREAVRQAFAGAEQERITSLQRYYDAEEKFRVASESANAAAEKKKTSALKAELRERESARAALATAEQNAARSLAVSAPAGTDSKKVLADIQAISKAEADLAALRRQQDLIGRAQVLQQGAVANASRPTGPTAESVAAANAYRNALDGVAGAQARNTASAAAMAAAWGTARAVGSSLFSFLGGPWGVALTAITGAMAAYGMSLAAAEARSRSIQEAKNSLVETLNKVAAAANASGRALDAVNPSRLTSQLRDAEVALSSLQGDALYGAISQNVIVMRQLAEAFDIKTDGRKFAEIGRELQPIFEAALRTEGGARKAAAALESLGQVRPDIDTSGIQKAIGDIIALIAAVNKARALAGQQAFEAGVSTDARDEAIRRQGPSDADRLRAARSSFIQSEKTLTKEIEDQAVATAQKNRRLQDEFALRQRLSQMSKSDRAIEELQQKYPTISRAEAAELAAREEAQSKRGGGGGGGRKGFTPEERFDNRVSLLREQGRAAFFTDLDRELIAQLKELKSDPGLAKRTTDAIISGGELPERAKEMRAALELKKSGELAREARDQYGTLSEVLPLVAERQRLLNLAVKEGYITQETANKAVQAYSNTLPAIAKMREGTDKLVDGLADIGLEMLTNKTYDWKKALASLAMEITKITLIAPLLKQLKDAMAGGPTGGGLGGIFSGLFGGLFGGGAAPTTGFSQLYHSGGIVGVTPAATRATPMSVFANAPRYHSGLKPNEFAAILERGEAVLTKRQQAGVAAMTSGAPTMVRQGDINIINNTPAQVSAERDSDGNVMIRVADAMASRAVSRGMQGKGAFADALPNEVKASRRMG